MTAVTLLPNETHVGGSGHGIITDGSDATSIMIPRTYEWLFGLSTVALPAGTRTREVRFNARISSAGTGGTPPVTGTPDIPITLLLTVRDETGTAYATGSTTVAGSSPVDRVTAPAAVDLTQTQVDALRFGVIHTHAPYDAGSGSYLELFVNLYEASVSLVYAAIPVVVVGAPSGPIVTSTPTLTWTFTGDPDADAGGIQQRYHARVFTAAQYGTGGFDPATSTAYWDSGEQVTNATSTIIGPLSDGITFKAYVRAAQNVNGVPHWSLWDDGPEFTTNTDPPHVATIVAASSSSSALGRSGQYRRPSQYPTQYNYLDTSAGWASTPDPVGELRTDYTFLARLRMKDLTGSGYIAEQAGSTSLWIYTGNPILGATAIGGAAAGGYLLDPNYFYAAFNDDEDFYFGGTYDLDAGAGNGKLSAITSTDGVTWTPVPGGTPAWAEPPAAITGIADSTAFLYIGLSGSSGFPLDGRIYSVEMQTGLEPGGPRYLAPTIGVVSTPDTPDSTIASHVRFTAKVRRTGTVPNATIVGKWTYLEWLWSMGSTGADTQFASSSDGAGATTNVQDMPGPPLDADAYIGLLVRADGVQPLSSTDGDTWTAGTLRPATPYPTADPANNPVMIGVRGGAPEFPGRIYWVQMERVDAAGNPTGIVWRFDAEEAPTDASTAVWADPRGRTWTAHTPAYLHAPLAISGRTLWRFDASEYPGTGTSYTDPRGRVWTLSNASTIVADGAVKITVTRDVAHRDWTHVNIERSAVDRLSWEPVRGALELEAPDDVVVAHDYEQPDGVDLWYRARGIIKSGAAVISQGPWLVTGQAVIWTPDDCGEYLRAPGDPFGAVMIEVVADEDTNATEHRVGLLNVIGRASPVTVWDVPSLPAGTLAVVTRSYDDGVALRDLIRTAPVLLWQGRRLWGHPYRWLVVTGHTVSRRPTADLAFAEHREWELAYVEVEPPTVTS